jgi:hypothetical protein
MPRIFDNIEQQLINALQETLHVSNRADFCVGYFNLRGWKQLDSYIEKWSGGDGNCCRLLVGKHYGFTDEELDFIINYDIKYRMGRESGEKE